jgi:hypothetical protein
MATTSYNFATPSDFTLDNVEITDLVAYLQPVNNPSQSFSQPLTSSSGFTFNSSYTAISGGLLSQIDQRPANESFFASLSTGPNANWTSGTSVTGTLTGTTSFSGGKLVLGADGLASWADPTGLQTGTVRVRYTPEYTGNPSDLQTICVVGQTINPGGAGGQNSICLQHKSSGVFQLTFFNSSSVDVGGVVLGTPSLVAGTEYEIELDFDLTGGATRVFLNGAQFGATQTTTFTRTATNYLQIGSSANTENFSVRNVECFTTVQHTSNYTAPSPLPSTTIYQADTITFPTFTYSGVGNIQAFTSATITDANSPGYVLNGLWWNGSSWATSNLTYAQSNPASTISSNIGTLPISNTLTVTAITQSSNMQETITGPVAFGYTGQIYGNGSITTSSPFTADQISNFSSVFSESGSDTVLFGFLVNDQLMWWNGSAWADSNGTAAQLNTLATVQANVSSLLNIELGSYVQIFVLLTSGTGATTPNVTSFMVTYTFHAPAPSLPNLCNVFGYIYDLTGTPIQGVTVTFKLSALNTGYYILAGQNLIGQSSVQVTTDITGFFQAYLVQSPQYTRPMPTLYVSAQYTNNGQIVNINKNSQGQPLTISVPNASSVNITSLLN